MPRYCDVKSVNVRKRHDEKLIPVGVTQIRVLSMPIERVLKYFIFSATLLTSCFLLHHIHSSFKFPTHHGKETRDGVQKYDRAATNCCYYVKLLRKIITRTLRRLKVNHCSATFFADDFCR